MFHGIYRTTVRAKHDANGILGLMHFSTPSVEVLQSLVNLTVDVSTAPLVAGKFLRVHRCTLRGRLIATSTACICRPWRQGLSSFVPASPPSLPWTSELLEAPQSNLLPHAAIGLC